MAERRKMKKARPYEQLMIIMLNGLPITKEAIAELLKWDAPRGSAVKGPKIYNVSSYIWDIKNIPQSPNGKSMVIKSIRDGKKVTAYQLMNLDDAKGYLIARGLFEPEKPKQAIPA